MTSDGLPHQVRALSPPRECVTPAPGGRGPPARRRQCFGARAGGQRRWLRVLRRYKVLSRTWSPVPSMHVLTTTLPLPHRYFLVPGVPSHQSVRATLTTTRGTVRNAPSTSRQPRRPAFQCSSRRPAPLPHRCAPSTSRQPRVRPSQGTLRIRCASASALLLIASDDT